ncbi:CG12541, partial [Drosophila busckii]
VKLTAFAEELSTSTGVSEEWGSGWRSSSGGTNFLVEVEQTAAMPMPPKSASNSSEELLGSLEEGSTSSSSSSSSTVANVAVNVTANVETGPKIIVRTEEVLIVGLVLVLWVGAIMLFFNRWGKIRMLEPYQPKFQQQHRSSCPLVDMDAVTTHQRSSVSRMSMGMVHQHNLNLPTCQFAAYNPSIYAKGYASHVSMSTASRPRQNSVFVGATTSHYLMPRPPRKTRSAMDLHSMVLDESAEQV